MDLKRKLILARNLIDNQIQINRMYYSVNSGSPGPEWTWWIQGYEPVNGPVRRDIQSLIIKLSKGEIFQEEWLAQLERPDVIKMVIATPERLMGFQLAQQLGWLKPPEDLDQKFIEGMISAISDMLDRAYEVREGDFELLLWIETRFLYLESLLDKYDNELLSTEVLLKLEAIRLRRNELERRFGDLDFIYLP